MTRNLTRIHETLKTKSHLFLQIKLLNDGTHFSDDSTKKINLYKTLGISSTASHNEIKKAYYDLTLKYHPDRNENCEKSATKFREVTEAYEILGSFSSKKKYDRGDPVSRIKKIKPTPIDHKARYQEFFDSRMGQNSFSQQSKDFDDFAKFTERNFGNVSSDLSGDKDPTVFKGIIVFLVFITLYFKMR